MNHAEIYLRIQFAILSLNNPTIKYAYKCQNNNDIALGCINKFQ